MADPSTFRYTVGSRKFTRTRNSLKKLSFTTTNSTNVSNSFNTAKAATLQVKAADEVVYIKPDYLVIKLTGIATSGTIASKLTIRITTDSDGDNTIFPDTEATIATGLTTNTTGVVSYSIQLPFVDTASAATTFYLIAKTDVADQVNIASADLYCTVETF